MIEFRANGIGSLEKIINANPYLYQMCVYHDNEGLPEIMPMVSNEISMNYTQFSQMFKAYTGSNFLLFLRDIRLEEGKKLLVATDLSVTEIARESGFQNEKHFMKSFKKKLGVSPSVYRNNIRGF